MEKPLLSDQNIFPTSEVLKETLGKRYAAFEELMNTIAKAEFSLTAEWKYYHDSKAWLCKVAYKKKTIFWLSVLDGFFRTNFYFMERHRAGVLTLPIDETLKEEFAKTEQWGKMLPLSVRITAKKQLKDVLTLVRYKKELYYSTPKSALF